MTQAHRVTCIVVASVAAALFVGAIVILWGHYPVMSEAATANLAVVLIIIWALGPAIWFLFEWWKWREEPGLEIGQRYARDFWLGAGAVVLILAAEEIKRSHAAPLSEYTIAWNLVVDVIRILAWPALAIAGFLLFRAPIANFFNALGSRASKIGAFSVTVELSSLPEARAWSGPALSDLKTEYPTAAGDSSGSLFSSIADTRQADYVTIDLEEGNAWLTSRLFILAAVIPRVRPIKQIVFLAGLTGEFVGTAPPAAVVASFAQRYKWLEQAYVDAHASIPDPERTLLSSLSPNNASTVLSQFLWLVRGPGTSEEWVNLGGYIEHAEWVSPDLLRRLLGAELEMSTLKRDPSVDGVTLAKTLLRHEARYVAVLDPAGRFAHLIDRYRAADSVIRRELS